MLTSANIDHDVVLYMKEKPDQATLTELVNKLEDDPADLVRRDKFFNDKIVGEEGFDPDSLSDPAVVIELLARHARLLQRPIVATDDVAIIGRPRDRVPALFGL